MRRLTGGALAALALSSIALALVAAPSAPAAAVGAADGAPPGTLSPPDSLGVGEITILVDGVPAHGIYALPRGMPAGIVVFAHGYGNTVDSWRGHVAETARLGAIAVAMDYSPYFDLDRGAAETAAAARFFRERARDTHVVGFGVSMGGAVSGIAVAESEGVFEWWVDVEGVANLYETWAEASAVGHPSRAQIEADTGGTPADDPAPYARRSPALRADEMRLNGLKGAIVVHDLNDGLVPANQYREMTGALRAARIPHDTYTVVRGPCSEQGTTGTGALLGAVPADTNPACLAGHAWEGSSTHPVMRTAFEALWGILDGSARPSGREVVVDAPGP